MIDFHKNGSYGASNADLTYAKAHGKYNLLSLHYASVYRRQLIYFKIIKGILMVISWMLCVSTGILFAR